MTNLRPINDQPRPEVVSALIENDLGALLDGRRDEIPPAALKLMLSATWVDLQAARQVLEDEAERADAELAAVTAEMRSREQYRGDRR